MVFTGSVNSQAPLLSTIFFFNLKKFGRKGKLFVIKRRIFVKKKGDIFVYKGNVLIKKKNFRPKR